MKIEVEEGEGWYGVTSSPAREETTVGARTESYIL